MEFDRTLKIRAKLEPVSFGGDRIELTGYKRDKHHCSYAQPVVMTNADEGTYITPFAVIDKHQAQILMDDLWSAGIRPTEGSGSAGSLKAVQNHLADMKKILFHKMGIKE